MKKRDSLFTEAPSPSHLDAVQANVQGELQELRTQHRQSLFWRWAIGLVPAASVAFAALMVRAPRQEENFDMEVSGLVALDDSFEADELELLEDLEVLEELEVLESWNS